MRRKLLRRANKNLNRRRPSKSPPATIRQRRKVHRRIQTFDILSLSDNSVTMKPLTRRQLSREPAQLKNIKPGESVFVPDAAGGLVVTRRKKNKLTAEQMFAEVERICTGCPPIDTLTVLQEGED